MSNKKASTDKEIIRNELPTLYVDGISANHREDGITYLSLTTHLPDCVVEQVRLMIDDDHLPQIIDLLCDLLGYFPQKPSKKRRLPSK